MPIVLTRFRCLDSFTFMDLITSMRRKRTTSERWVILRYKCDRLYGQLKSVIGDWNLWRLDHHCNCFMEVVSMRWDLLVFIYLKYGGKRDQKIHDLGHNICILNGGGY